MMILYELLKAYNPNITEEDIIEYLNIADKKEYIVSLAYLEDADLDIVVDCLEDYERKYCLGAIHRDSWIVDTIYFNDDITFEQLIEFQNEVEKRLRPRQSGKE